MEATDAEMRDREGGTGGEAAAANLPSTRVGKFASQSERAKDAEEEERGARRQLSVIVDRRRRRPREEEEEEEDDFLVFPARTKTYISAHILR